MSAVRSMAVSTVDLDGKGTDAPPPLTPRQRLALFRGIMPPDRALSVRDEELTLANLRSNGVTAANFRCAKLDARALKALGVQSALTLRELGFDALDLTDAALCASAVAAFGAYAVKQAFLIDPGDAVALAGSVATFHLQLDTNRLLQACTGAPEQAKAVLQQAEPKNAALCGVHPTTLLDCGLRGPVLISLGYFSDAVAQQTGADAEQLRKLGYTR